MNSSMELNIALIEPRIPQNVGNIARTCAAVGARLHLVEPMAFVIDDSKLRRAGLDYWHMLDISIYKDTDEFFQKNSGNFIEGRSRYKHLPAYSKSHSTLQRDGSGGYY